jgi:hypothetical protein
VNFRQVFFEIIDSGLVEDFVQKSAKCIFGRDEACYGNDFPSILLLIWTYVCGLEQNNMFIYRKA